MKETSFRAYEHITNTGKRETLKEQVYGFIRCHPNCTQIEVREALGESARKRIAELVGSCKIEETGIVDKGSLHYTTYDIFERDTECL